MFLLPFAGVLLQYLDTFVRLSTYAVRVPAPIADQATAMLLLNLNTSQEIEQVCMCVSNACICLQCMCLFPVHVYVFSACVCVQCTCLDPVHVSVS